MTKKDELLSINSHDEFMKRKSEFADVKIDGEILEHLLMLARHAGIRTDDTGYLTKERIST